MADKPELHGRDHRPGGADPIPTTATGIQYNTLNDGEWLWVATESAVGSGLSYGMTLRDNSGLGMELYSTSKTHLYSGGILDVDSGSVDLHSFGNIAFDGDADIAITADGEFTFTASGAGLTTITSEGIFSIGSNNDQAVLSAAERIAIASANAETWVLLPNLVGTPSDYSFAVGASDGAGGMVTAFRVDNDGSVHTIGPVVEDL